LYQLVCYVSNNLFLQELLRLQREAFEHMTRLQVSQAVVASLKISEQVHSPHIHLNLTM